jgi:hypothetical protein
MGEGPPAAARPTTPSPCGLLGPAPGRPTLQRAAHPAPNSRCPSARSPRPSAALGRRFAARVRALPQLPQERRRHALRPIALPTSPLGVFQRAPLAKPLPLLFIFPNHLSPAHLPQLLPTTCAPTTLAKTTARLLNALIQAPGALALSLASRPWPRSVRPPRLPANPVRGVRPVRCLDIKPRRTTSSSRSAQDSLCAADLGSSVLRASPEPVVPSRSAPRSKRRREPAPIPDPATRPAACASPAARTVG